MKRIVLALLLALAAGCQGCHLPLPPPNTPVPGLDGPATCADVCANGNELGCPFAQKTPAGATCETVCANNQAAGIAPWNLGCRTSATSCAAIDACQ